MNIAAVSFDNLFFRNVLKRLSGLKHKIEFIWGIGDPRQFISFNAKEVLSHMDLMDPRMLKKRVSQRFDVPDYFLANLKDAELDFLRSFDRFSYYSKSYSEINQIFLDYVQFWYSRLTRENIDAVIFPASPHMCFDIVLFHVARQLKILTLFPERTLLDFHMLMHENYVINEKVPVEFNKELSLKELRAIIPKSIHSKLKLKSIWSDRSVNKASKVPSNKIKGIVKSFIEYQKFSLSLLKKRDHSQLNSSYIAFNQNRLERFRSIKLRLHEVRVFKKYRELRKYYRKTAFKFKQGKDEMFVYFPLHFQPERSTSPMGGVFCNQLLAIKILSRALEKFGIRLYVKEHPRQLFFPRINAFNVRSKEFYEEIANLQNVRLIDVYAESDSLIKESEFVATVTGSVGWEAGFSGKGAIVFGNPWYSASNNVFKVNDLQSCIKSIEQLLNITRESVEWNIYQFLAYFKDRFFISLNSEQFFDSCEYSYQELVENMAREFTAER